MSSPMSSFVSPSLPGDARATRFLSPASASPHADGALPAPSRRRDREAWAASAVRLAGTGQPALDLVAGVALLAVPAALWLAALAALAG